MEAKTVGNQEGEEAAMEKHTMVRVKMMAEEAIEAEVAVAVVADAE